MPVSGNEETGVKSLGGQASLNIAGVPMKKRRIIWPPSPTFEEQSSLPVENDSLEKEHINPSRDSELVNASVSASSSVLSDSNKKFAPEENKKPCDNNLSKNSINNSRHRIEEPSTDQSDSLAKLDDDDEKLETAEKSANILSGVKPLGGVPMKKRRFIRPPSPAPAPAPEVQSLAVLEYDSVLKEHGRLPQVPALSSASVAGSSCLSDENKNFFPEAKNMVPVSIVHTNSINLSRVKIEELHTIQSESLANLDNAGKLVAAEKSATILVKYEQTELNSAPNKAPALYVDKEIVEQQIAEGKCKAKSTVSGNPELALGLKDHHVCALEDQIHDGKSCNHRNVETVSLNLSLSNGERTAHCKIDDVQSNIDSANICANRFNWDLNTTMDTWEGSVGDVAVGQVTADGSHMVGVTHHIEPLTTGTVGTGVATEIQIVESECMSSSSKISSQSGQQYNSDDSFHLRLSPSFLSFKNQEPSISSANIDSQTGISISSPRGLLSAGNRVISKTIKSEPLDDNLKNDSGRTKVNLAVPLDFRAVSVKSELVEKFAQEAHKALNFSTVKPVDAKSMKSEPFYDVDSETRKTMEGTSHQQCESAGQLAPEIGSQHVSHSGDAINGSATVDVAGPEKKNINDFDQCKLKAMDELPSDAHRNGEGTASDEEKINLSGDMLEEDSYGTEYESDGNSVPMDIEDDGQGQDDYEDGEFREAQLRCVVESPISEKRDDIRSPISEKRDDISHGDSDSKMLDSTELHPDVHPTPSSVEGQGTNAEQPVEINKDSVEECIDTILDGKPTNDVDKDASREESSAVEISASGADKKKVVKTVRRKPLDLSANNDATKGLGTEQSPDQGTSEGKGTLVAVAQGTVEKVNTNDVEKNDSALPKLETSINADGATKDVSSGANQSRIINLTIASGMSSGKTKCISGKPLPLHLGRERLPDVPLDPRGRDESYEGSRKFARERYQDQSSRNSRWNSVHGRGRLASRIDSMCSDRDSEHYCIPRHKYASAVAGSDSEFMNYNIGLDGAFVGSLRGGRKVLEDDASILRHLSSRGHSPGGRDGPASRGFQMVRRVPRRSIGEDDSEVVGLRHAEKIIRGFPDDGEEHAYTHPQPPYEGLNGRFVQGTRNFSSLQRRGLHQMHSKSPVRSRSPGPWSSSRRRSPDGFGGPLELPHRRSPIYRMERIRSPDSPGFPAERVPRRRGSPSYMSRPNDMREVDPCRDHGHPRSIISNRSPTGRVFLRNRRFGVADPRQRPENDEFFEGPMHPGRFHELGGNGNDEERRFGERRAPVRSFRAPFNGADGENFPVNAEDGRRSFRFFPENDSDFHERANLRESEFDRRIKHHPGNAPRRPRNIEEEGNYRHGGQVLYDDSFDEMSRLKRKRF